VWYFEFEKDRMKRKRIAEASKGMGRPKVGGTFELIDQNGKPFTSDMMKGKFSLVRMDPTATCFLIFMLTNVFPWL
jgi:protein SCO1/2